ncbi:rubredoxin [Methylocucumis oryzae]|uniref:Rubredoxin n=1 Tax=Methylocucumis oryzae TaxID=1632867 RepID=A0A0F3IIU1_9GAMM|nr:rubredoxin [Methylocucumis oryzae]KJV06597.1 rubredoxin [Methylocucumis oryzae]
MTHKAFFAGAFGIDSQRVTVETKLECKICWYIYDPAEGDDEWQIAPGTAFTDLPEHWTCPQCSATKRDFLVLVD